MDKKKDSQDFKVIHCNIVAGCTAVETFIWNVLLSQQQVWNIDV